MAPLRPEKAPGWDDGPSRRGVGLRRTAIVAIAGLLAVSTPPFVLIIWGMANPTYGPGTAKQTTLTWTMVVNIERADWSRLVHAADSFAIQHGLIDEQTGSLAPTSELRRRRVSYESKDAELEVERQASEANAATVEVRIKIREFDESGAGLRLKSAFEDDVLRAGHFGEQRY